jgi:hypothetical protein
MDAVALVLVELNSAEVVAGITGLVARGHPGDGGPRVGSTVGDIDCPSDKRANQEAIDTITAAQGFR